ncbi:MAG: restriction endonuclease subunit S [Melioribacteraceae bacterium]|nr:restriction endonuclease subunit S [Melioribacteraceae bacterium]
MQYKNLIQKLGFSPKENTSGIYQKKYSNCEDYCIEIDFEERKLDFGNLINVESKTTQNFSQNENWVVLECVNRLLEKGYKPQNITLEKTYPSGHGTSGRLDILVSRNDATAYLMIECKTWGSEFEKEFKKIGINGGQLFTYFQQDKNADVLMLYASVLEGEELKYKNEIVKIEEVYKQTNNVKDFYERWNKLPKSNGVFDAWVKPYEFHSKALTKKDLRVLKQEDSSFIFNRFLEILRHNVVSDKPNAFNKIFTLFLCKIMDENVNDDEQLHFQWIEGEDDHISFQKRLTDLYNRGMLELLEKKVTDVSDSEFDKRFQQVDKQYREEFKEILTEIRLKKNNEFAIKEVYDDASFEENAKVVKEVVELLQVYKIRYNYRQQFLSDFFELLLTTGLKQESGQFFTPVPIARFIIKSIPLKEIANKKIRQGNKNDLLPLIIDYAAGSGHFITESMEEVQKYIDSIDENKYTPSTKRALKKWKDDQFDWADDYIYAIEKDYRLVKTAKVSCYLHGDGLAKVIHGDGLGDFSTSTEFKDLLKETDRTYKQDNKQFDIVISNPPYSVSAFKGTMMDRDILKNAFELYPRLTDQSSEIECLFIERTKQLLKDGGIAGIILPSSILSNTGIYTQTREIILKNFEIVAIAELGSSTFMATGTNTVTLFLRRRNNADATNIKASVDNLFVNQKDVTINGIEKPVKKYITHVWEGITFDDYITLLNKTPNEAIEQHEIYKEYQKKIKATNSIEKWNNILKLEQEKLFYFILAYPQKLVLLKTGEKKEEKQFLGYEFSNRRGSEGIHPIQRGKTIDDCTELYDINSLENSDKASTYIYKAFKGKFDLEIPDSLKKNISYLNLVDMFTFDRVDFEKNISLSVKKKVAIKSKWKIIRLENVCDVRDGTHESPLFVEKGYALITSKNITNGKLDFTNVKNISEKNFNEINKRSLVENGDILYAMIGTIGFPVVVNTKKKFAIKNVALFKYDKSKILNNYYLKELLNNSIIENQILQEKKGSSRKFVSLSILRDLKIPLPPKSIQEKIVSKIKILEKKEKKAIEKIENLKTKIDSILNVVYATNTKRKQLGNMSEIKNGGTPNTSKQEFWDGEIPWATLVDTKRKYLTKTARNISKDGLLKSSAVLLPVNSVLFSSRATIGDVSITKIEVCTNQGYKNFICDTDKLHFEYLYHILKRESKNIESLASGMTYPEISKTLISEYKIPLPTLSKQKQIVSKIEKIEKQISELEKSISAIPKEKDAILKKYLE